VHVEQCSVEGTAVRVVTSVDVTAFAGGAGLKARAQAVAGPPPLGATTDR
jgi:hypothetical protein